VLLSICAAGGDSDGDSAAAGSDSDIDSEQQRRQRGKRAKKQSPARPARRARRRGAGQVDYQLLHEQLFGFSAFEADAAVFKEDDDEDFDSDQGTVDSDD
jgi:hypothetical protein